MVQRTKLLKIIREELTKIFQPFYLIYFTMSINTMLEEYFQWIPAEKEMLRILNMTKVMIPSFKILYNFFDPFDILQITNPRINFKNNMNIIILQLFIKLLSEIFIGWIFPGRKVLDQEKIFRFIPLNILNEVRCDRQMFRKSCSAKEK